MHVVSDGERRRVAAMLRMSDERDAAGFVDCLLAEVIRGREFCETPCEECHARLLGELADLIEPSCDRDALLRLARYMDMDVAETEAHFSNVISTKSVSDYARRIREACGEVVG